MPASFSPDADRWAIAVAGAALLVVAAVAFADDLSPEWAKRRAEVRRVVAERLGPERAARLPEGLEQVWIPELRRVDRCVACHAAIGTEPALLAAKNPARSHPPPDVLAKHPVETFGCTLCHGGQGAATSMEAAHGDVPFWDEPLLGRARAARYALTPAELMETNCNVCHRRDASTEGLTLVNEAKELVRKELRPETRCASCHRIDGVPADEARGPDLSREGEKPPAHLVFPDGWDGPRTALEWHTKHFLNPKSVVPDSKMPVFNFTERQARALALLVLSWKTNALPPAWTPGAKRDR